MRKFLVGCSLALLLMALAVGCQRPASDTYAVAAATPAGNCQMPEFPERETPLAETISAESNAHETTSPIWSWTF